MTDRKRTLHAVRPVAKKPAVTFAMLRRAVSLYRNDMVPREQWKALARKWVSARLWLGDRHILSGRVLKGGVLSGAIAKWGQPGDAQVSQVYAPRRLGER